MKKSLSAFLSFAALALAACSKSDDSTTTTTTTLPAVYSKIYGATSITTDGTWVTIKSTGMPDSSVYYPTSDSRY